MVRNKYNLRKNYILNKMTHFKIKSHKTQKSLKLISLFILSFFNLTKATNYNNTCCFKSSENKYLLNLLDVNNFSYSQDNNTDSTCFFPFQTQQNISFQNLINSLNCSKNIKINYMPHLLLNDKRRLQEIKSLKTTEYIDVSNNNICNKLFKKNEDRNNCEIGIAIADSISALFFFIFSIVCCILIFIFPKILSSICCCFSLASFILTLINSILIFSSDGEPFMSDLASVILFCISLLLACFSFYLIDRYKEELKMIYYNFYANY